MLKSLTCGLRFLPKYVKPFFDLKSTLQGGLIHNGKIEMCSIFWVTGGIRISLIFSKDLISVKKVCLVSHTSSIMCFGLEISITE